jgi:catechol 2,3-dioxygenase-like lactoylglutathione lyase family enzyme
MATQMFGKTEICQVAIVVKDIEAAAKAYAEVFGVEVAPAVVTAPEEQSHTKFCGRPTKAQAKLAFIPMGSCTLELIEPVGGPSTWKKFLDEHGEGVHHIALRIAGMDKVLKFCADHGMPTEQTGDFPGGRYGYVDAIAKLGVNLELLENLK